MTATDADCNDFAVKLERGWSSRCHFQVMNKYLEIADVEVGSFYETW